MGTESVDGLGATRRGLSGPGRQARPPRLPARRRSSRRASTSSSASSRRTPTGAALPGPRASRSARPSRVVVQIRRLAGGSARDISGDGMFVVTDAPLPIGARTVVRVTDEPTATRRRGRRRAALRAVAVRRRGGAARRGRHGAALRGHSAGVAHHASPSRRGRRRPRARRLMLNDQRYWPRLERL